MGALLTTFTRASAVSQLYFKILDEIISRVKCQIGGYFLGHYEIGGYTTRDPGVLFETLHDMSTAVKKKHLIRGYYGRTDGGFFFPYSIAPQ